MYVFTIKLNYWSITQQNDNKKLIFFKSVLDIFRLITKTSAVACCNSRTNWKVAIIFLSFDPPFLQLLLCMYYYDVLHYIDYLEKFDASTITIFQYVIEMVTVQCGMVHGLVGVDRVHKYLVLTTSMYLHRLPFYF